MRQYAKASPKKQTRLGALYHLQRDEPQMAREFIIIMMDNDTCNQAKNKSWRKSLELKDTSSMQLAS